MERWVGLKNLLFCSGYNASTLVFNSTKEVFRMQGAWNSPNTLPTIDHNQAFRIITVDNPTII